MIGDFCGIAVWHPAIAKCEAATKEGATVRTLTLKGGGTITERQTTRDDAAHSSSYTILSSPLPVVNYASTISVVPNSDGAKINWAGHFDAKGATDEKASEVIGGIYDDGLSVLESTLK